MRLSSLILAFFLCLSAWASDVYTVIVNPGENASKSVRLNWHSDIDNDATQCFYTDCSDIHWARAKKVAPQQEICEVFDSMYSKTPEGENFYERVRFIRNTAELKNLTPGTRYMYRIGNDLKDGETRYFHTAPQSGEWSAAIISDIHTYTPLPKRVEAAMTMLDTIEATTMVCGTKGGGDLIGGCRINGIRQGRQFDYSPNLNSGGVAFYDGDGGATPSTREARLFINAVKNGTEPSTLPEQAYCVTRILEGIYESAKTGDIYRF